MNSRIYTILFFLTILIAVFFRFYDLGNVPLGPDWDEAALGYNAYSLLKTGRDEYGSFMPLMFRSFNDYKPPLYVYLTIPSVAVFGLNLWAVRLVSALAGVFAVVGTYYLVRELLTIADSLRVSAVKNLNLQKSSKAGAQHSGTEESAKAVIPLTAALLIAMSPWHTFFSRVAFEANLAVTFNIWGIYLFLKGRNSPGLLIISFVLFAFGIYSYHTERIFVPMLIVIISSYVISKNMIKLRDLTYPILVLFIFCIPAVLSLFNSQAVRRFESTSIFRKQTELLLTSVSKSNWDRDNHSFVGMVLNNYRFEWSKIIASGYLSHFSPRWLFASGDQPRHHVPDSGLLYIFTAPFIFIGLISLFGFFKPIRALLLGWLAISPIASSLTFEVPHAVRSIVFLPVFDIIGALGIWIACRFLKDYTGGKPLILKYVLSILLFLSVTLSVLEIVRYWDLYFRHMNTETSQYWQYGYKEAVDYIRDHDSEYDKVVISPDLEEPYMFVLFFTKYPPEEYLAEGGSEYKTFGKFEFHKINWANEYADGKTLYVDIPANSPEPNLMLVRYLNGQPAISISDKKPI